LSTHKSYSLLTYSSRPLQLLRLSSVTSTRFARLRIQIPADDCLLCLDVNWGVTGELPLLFGGRGQRHYRPVRIPCTTSRSELCAKGAGVSVRTSMISPNIASHMRTPETRGKSAT